MKKFITTIAMLLLFAIGCTDQTSITSPEQSIQTQEPNWIALPQVEGMHVNQDWTTSKRINGAQGGYLTNNVNYSGGISGIVTINARLEFDQGAYAGNETITLTLNNQNTSAQFGPERAGFNRLVHYDVLYTGLNLSGLNLANIKFAYIASDGSVQYAVNDGIVVDLATGKLGVINARIPHFSRYGFVN